MKKFFFVFSDGNILMERLSPDTYTIPCQETSPTAITAETRILDITTLNGMEVKAYSLASSADLTAVIASATLDSGNTLEPCGLRESYYKLSTEEYLIAGKCAELLYWDTTTRYCGVCGTEQQMNTPISKLCPNCGRESWPLLSTAIIVLIHRGDEVLLVHGRDFKRKFFGLVAGFVETGESLEEAVHREVMEETGIEITNLRYFSSQPWPYPCGLMVGFNADYVSGEIKLQESELAAGAWFHRDSLPPIPEKLSIARRLIDAWLDTK